jgi:hypothetical protein
VGIATPGAKKDKKDKNAAKAEKDAVKEVKAFLVMAEHCADTLYSFYEKACFTMATLDRVFR